MEDNFYLDDFELSLKEQANQFKMIPSKRVWHGIYNDIHPGRRWPSITISLLLIISIVFVGYINTHDKKIAESQLQAPVKNDKQNEIKAGFSHEKLQTSTKQSDQKSNYNNISTSKETNNTVPVYSAATNDGHNHNVLPGKNNGLSDIGIQNNKTTPGIAYLENRSNQLVSGSLKNEERYLENKTLNSNAVNDADIDKENGRIENTNIIVNNTNDNLLTAKVAIPDNDNNKTIKLKAILSDQVNLDNPEVNSKLSAQQKAGDVALVSGQDAITKARQKKNTKITWTYYAAPFVGIVAFSGNHLNENLNQNSLSLPQVTQKDIRVMHNAALGFEAGFQMNYLFAKKLQLTAGAHFTRSGYNIISNEVHPTLTTLLLRDKSNGDIYSRSFVTHYGDGTGQSTTTLHNYNYQASLPIGLQYELWGNDKIQFNLGGNIEPSLSLKSNAYILSSDGKNYVNVPDLARKWNLSSNFAPFITFKSARFNWNIGPNIRYQWLSSYMDDYTIKEHLIDYGIRLGISK